MCIHNVVGRDLAQKKFVIVFAIGPKHAQWLDFFSEKLDFGQNMMISLLEIYWIFNVNPSKIQKFPKKIEPLGMLGINFNRNDKLFLSQGYFYDIVYAHGVPENRLEHLWSYKHDAK